MRSIRWVKMVVFPLPVGEETPIRVTPEERAERQSKIHSSWYGRREKAGVVEETNSSALGGGGVASSGWSMGWSDTAALFRVP